MAHELREYQEEALKQLSENFKKGIRHTVLKVSCGGGKTSIASVCIKRALKKNPKLNIMFICDRIELINQTSIRFTDDGIDHGVIQANHPKENGFKNVQICSIQTLARRNYKKPDLVFIDEAHTLYTEHKRLMEMYPDTPIIGLTATPYTKGLGKYFKGLIVGATTRQLQELGFLVKARVFAPSAPDLELLLNKDKNKEDFDVEELAQASNTPKLVGDIIEHWLKLAKNKPTICFAVNIAHSKSIKEAFCKVGINCEHLDAYTDEEERRDIIKRFKAGEIKVLTSVDILSKGFDYPGAEVAILARATKSLALYIQQAGRVLRICKETGKKEALILDHSGNTERHGFCDEDNDYELDTGEKPKAGVAYKKVKKEVNATCPSCLFVKKTVQCENCGFEHLPENKVVSAEGYLQEIENHEIFGKTIKKSSKEMLSCNPEELYGQLLQLCKDKKWKDGRAFFMFKDIAGYEPSWGIKNNAKIMPVSKEVKGMVTHLNIKKAKSHFKNQKSI